MSDTNSMATLTAEGAIVDGELAALLSRLAALRGRAIPVHRFGMTSVLASGVDVAGMDRITRAMELWLSAIPEGSAQVLTHLPDRQDLPMLWMPVDGSSVTLVRGLLGTGAYALESADGTSKPTPGEVLAQGVFLSLTTELASAEETDELTTARSWFMRALKRRRPIFAEAMVATTVVNLLALGASLYSMQVYDRVIPTQGYSTLMVLTLGVLMAMAFEFIMKQVRSRLVDKACKSIDDELSSEFFSRLLHIRMDARPRSVGTLASQFRQFELVRNFMTSTTLFLLADAPFILFFVLVIFFIAGPLALVPLALLPICIAVGFIARWKLGRLAEQQLKDANLKNGVLVEAIDGIEAVKAVGGEWKLLDRWRQLNGESGERELEVRHISFTASNLAQTLQQAGYVALVACGVYAITSGNLTMGGLIACTIISNRALGPIAQIAAILVQWQHATSALKGLDQFFVLPSDRPPGERMVIPERCDGELKLDAASFSYGAGTALQPTHLVIKPGQRVAVIGTVGSGKTTLIKLLTGLYKPTQGRSFLDGVDMVHISPDFLREQMGYMTQDVRLFSGTLRDNLTLGLSSPSDTQVLAAAVRTGLDRVIKSHPKGLDLPISEGGRGLSGGQRQLVGLTRMLLARPGILLLDEPTASMDAELEAFVMKNLFEQLPRESVVVLATHKRALLQLVDRIIAVDQGRIVLDGPRDEVLNQLTKRPAKGVPASGQASLPDPSKPSA